MRRFIFTVLLILGFGVFANAQDNDLAGKADKLALELTQAVNGLMKLEINMDDYQKKCNAVGVKMGLHIANLSEEEIQTYLNNFYNSLYYHFASYGIDKETADYLIDSFKKGLSGAEDSADEQEQEQVPATDKADGFAQQIAYFLEAAMYGTQDDKAMENMGVEIGEYLAGLTESDVLAFKEQFYKSLRVYVLRIENMDEETCDLLMDMFREQFEQVFDIFL